MLAPAAILFALPIVLLAVARPRRPKTHPDADVTRVLCTIVLLAGFGAGTASWATVLHESILLGLAREARDDVRAVTFTEAP